MGPQYVEENPPDSRTPLLSCAYPSDIEKPDVSGGATAWAAWGLAWTAISAEVLIRRVASPTDLQPALHINNARPPTWRLILLRIIEAVSTLILASLLYQHVAKPLHTQRAPPPPDGKFVVGGFLALVSDGFLNGQRYLFAWNSHTSSTAATGPPSCPSTARRPPPPATPRPSCGAPAHARLFLRRRRWPGIGDVAAFAAVWAGAVVVGFCVENALVAATHAYAFAKTYRPLTVGAGATTQFLLCGSAFVATLGCLFTWVRVRVRVRAGEDLGGVSPVGRGYHRWGGWGRR